MSAAHLSEAVHAAGSYKPAAVRRAELMRELCGPNTLRLPSDLPTAELTKLLSGKAEGRLSIDEIRSEPGSWFGAHVSLDGMAENRDKTRLELLRSLDKLPRSQRRKLKSQLSFESRSGREKWRELLKSGAKSVVLPFPLSLIDQKFATSWLLGEVSNVEFRRRVLEITHDPYILFEYLVDETEIRQRLYNSLRAIELFSDEASELQLINSLLPFAKSDTVPDVRAMANAFFVLPKILRQIISSHGVDANRFPDSDLRATIRACPSLFTYIETCKSIMETRLSSYLSRVRMGNTKIKKSRPSDFGDIMHSYYAPYFDIFRCDAAFGAHLKKHAPIRQKIADRIGDLPEMLSDTSC